MVYVCKCKQVFVSNTFDTIDHDILLAYLMVSEDLPSIGSKDIYTIASNISATMVVYHIN